MIPWAQDRWFGEDKLHHAVWCYAGELTLLVARADWFTQALILTIAILAVERIQWVRWELGYTRFADRPSYRDMVAGVVGALLAIAFWLVAHAWLVPR